MFLRSTTVFIIILFLSTLESSAQQRQIDSIKSVLPTLAEDSVKARCYLKLCILYRGLSNDNVIEYAEKALRLANKTGYKKGKGHAYNILAFANHRKGNLTEASNYQLKARDIYVDLKDTADIASASGNIGILYCASGQIEESIPYFREAYFLSAVISDQQRVLQMLYNLGWAHSELDKNSVSLSYLTKALRLSQEINDKQVRSSILGEIGKIYYKLGDLTEATRYLAQALVADNEASHSVRYEILISFTRIYCATARYKLAIESGEEALALARKVDDRAAISACYEQLSQAYAAITNFEKAFHYHVQFKQVQDSLMSVRNVMALKKLNNKRELGKKEAEMTILKQQLADDTFRRNTFTVVLLTGLIAATLFYRSYRAKSRLPEQART